MSTKDKRFVQRPLLCVLSPHCDDAVLSMGGQLALLAQKMDILITDVFTKLIWSIHHKKIGFSVRWVSRLRWEEDGKYARTLGASLHGLGFAEMPLRLQRESGGKVTMEDAQKRLYEAPPRMLVEAIQRKLLRLLLSRRPEIIAAPMAIGQHSDHRAVHLAFLHVYHELKKKDWGGRVWLYEDIPYGFTREQEVKKAVGFVRSTGMTLKERRVDISRTILPKLHGIGIYRSQFSPKSFILQVVQRHGRWLGHGKRVCERYWEMA